MLGITIADNCRGIGDKIQFTSLPENYYRTFGRKLIDVSKCWVFDHNPYVERDVEPTQVKELWNFPMKEPWPVPDRPQKVYLSNAELHALRFGAKVFLNRPRLYTHEEFPFDWRHKILLHAQGKSHGRLPDHIVNHVIKKYGWSNVYHLCRSEEPSIGIPRIECNSVWELILAIYDARMLIGPDSGPSWIAACYPDVIIKKVRLLKPHGQPPYENWVPLSVDNHHSHWDDRLAQIYVDSEDDVGPFWSWRKI